MANMTSGTDEPQQQRSSTPQGSDLASKLSQGASEAREHALERVQRARDRLQEDLAQRRSRISERIRDVSEVLDSAGRRLGDDDVIAGGLHYVSNKIDGVATYIEDADPSRLAHDLRDAVRERPAWFFGGAFMIGLALGRFAKSSAEALAEEAGEAGTRGTRMRAAGGLQENEPVSAHHAVPVGGQGVQAGTPAAGREGSQGGARPPAVPSRDQGARQP